MTRHGAFGLVLLSALAGCAPDPDAPIFLACKGESIVLVTKERKPFDMIYKIDPKASRSAVQFYDRAEKRFIFDCPLNSSCSLTIEPDRISFASATRFEEDGKIVMTRELEIDRKSGKLRETTDLVNPPIAGVSLEGQCEKTDPPPEAEAKF